MAKILNHDQDFARVEHYAAGTGAATNFADLKSKVEAHASANGFSLVGDVLSSDLTTSVRGDADLGLEKVNIELRSSSSSLHIHQTSIGEELPTAVDFGNAGRNILFNEGTGTTATEELGPDVFTLENGATWRSDPWGGYALDTSAGGVNNHAVKSSPNTAWWQPSSPWSYDAVVYLDNIPTHEQYFISIKTTVSGNALFWGINSSGALTYNSGSFTNFATFATPFANAANIGRWVHTAVTYNGSTLSFYLDGQLVDSLAIVDSQLVDGGAPVVIGNADPNVASTSNIEGALARVTYWENYVLTQPNLDSLTESLIVGVGLTTSKDLSNLVYPLDLTVIVDGSGSADASMLELITDDGSTVRHFYAGLANRERAQANLKIAPGASLPAQPFTHHWNMETTGGIDEVGGADLSTLTGSPSVVSSDIAGLANAVDFAATGERISTAGNAPADFGSTEFTVAAWCKITLATGVRRRIMSIGNLDSTDTFFFAISPTDKLELSVADGSGGYATVSNESIPATETLLIATFDGTTARLFIDDVEVTYAAQLPLPGTLTPPANPLYVGGLPNDNAGLAGHISWLGYAPKVLSAEERTALHQSGAPTSQDPATYGLPTSMILPKQNGEFFMPDNLDPTKANFKSPVQLRSQTTGDYEKATLTGLANENTGAGTVDLTLVSLESPFTHLWNMETTGGLAALGGVDLSSLNGSPAIIASDIAGLGDAVDFAATNDFLATPGNAPASLTPSEFSWFYWGKFNNTVAAFRYYLAIVTGGTPATQPLLIRANTSDQIEMFVSDGITQKLVAQSTAAMPATEALYLFTFDGTTGRIYIDNTEITYATQDTFVSTITLPSNVAPLSFGGYAGVPGDTADGHMSFVGFAPKVLSAADRTELYQAGSPPSQDMSDYIFPIQGSYGPGSLLGINPQPLILLEGESGETVENGVVEAITLSRIGERVDSVGDPDPPDDTDDEPAEGIHYGYATTEGPITGRPLGMRPISTTATLSDKQEAEAWNEAQGRDTAEKRLYELRLTSPLPRSPEHTWPLNEADFSSGALDTPYAGITAIDMAAGTTPPISASGLFGSQDAADYNGNGWLELDEGGNFPAALLPSGAWAYAVWLNVPSLGSIEYFLRASEADPNRVMNTFIDSMGTLGFNVYNDGISANGKSAASANSAGNKLIAGKDHLGVFYYDGEAPRIFLGSDTDTMVEVSYATSETYGTPTDIAPPSPNKGYIATNHTQSIFSDRKDSVIYFFSGVITVSDVEALRLANLSNRELFPRADILIPKTNHA